MAIRNAFGAWLISRGLVIGSLAVARHVFEFAGVGKWTGPLGQGLTSWDASHYAEISRFGYGGVAHESLRFFPLLPLLGRLAEAVTPFHSGQGIVVVANVVSLLFFLRLYGFVHRETKFDSAIAARAVWIAALAPPAFIFVMGYAESLFLLCAVSALDAARRGRWLRVAPWAFAAGLTRPPGTLLAIPIAIEALLAWRAAGYSFAPKRRLVAQLVATAAAPAGMLSFLWWARRSTKTFFEPLRIHERTNLRGGTENPISSVWDAFRDLLAGDRVGSGMHFFSAIAIFWLLIVLWRHAPRSLFAYGLASALVALSAANLDSLERYALATVPFILAAAIVVRHKTVERGCLIAGSAGIVTMSFLAFSGALVP